MPEILIIDDDIEACETMASLTTRQGHNADCAHLLKQGLQLALRKKYDIVFLDVFLPDGNGLDILPQLRNGTEPPEIIILTGKGNPDGAEMAIQGGAWDYLLKPTSVKDITFTLNQALKYRKEKRIQAPQKILKFGEIIGSSQEIRESLEKASRAAASSSNVLITGETGTGKELFASTIHKNSARANRDFVVVDCTSLTESLIESTLFGHIKGSFTGAQDNREGLISGADGGTLFLDEIGEMPLSIQKVFLRVLQEKQYRPVGGTRELTSNFRLIAATNRDLDQMVREGEFRSDLLFRINTMHIHLPPLRQRITDIEKFVNHKLDKLVAETGLQAKNFSDDFFTTLKKYSWPGNIRELLAVLEIAFINAGNEETLYSMHLPRRLRVEVAKKQVAQSTTGETLPLTRSPETTNTRTQIFKDISTHPLPTLKTFKNTAEATYINELLRQGNGDIKKILKISGLSRSHFYSLLKKYKPTDG